MPAADVQARNCRTPHGEQRLKCVTTKGDLAHSETAPQRAPPCTCPLTCTATSQGMHRNDNEKYSTRNAIRLTHEKIKDEHVWICIRTLARKSRPLQRDSKKRFWGVLRLRPHAWTKLSLFTESSAPPLEPGGGQKVTAALT
ncbi:hypothetical protein V5799_011403 [Amblyomma americanum]|uniref:Uncharacterized protein n=1 Tax=Amblyomma americanum TaxID=6943 RepID=A0AAQ4EH91_AMBAM